MADSTEELRKRLAALSPADRARLAGRLHAGSESVRESPAVPTLSYQQRNFWILHQMAEDKSTYNALLIVSLTGPLSAGSLREAVCSVARDYRIFRTVYTEEGGRIAATVKEDLLPDFLEVQWTGHPATFEDDAIERLREVAIRPFDLASESPLRARLYRLDEQRHVLGFVLHHIANDGLTYGALWTAVKSAYEAAERGATPPRPPDAAQYEAYAARQQSRLSTAAEEEALRYWTAQLHHAPGEMAFTYDYPGGSGPRLTEAEAALPLGSLHDEVIAFARAESTTPNVVYLAAYFAWWFRQTGRRDMIIGVPVSARQSKEDEQVLGCCINMLSIRQSVDPEWTFKETVRHTRKVMMEGIRHADMPFLRLVEELSHEQKGAFGFYNTTFQYRNFVPTFAPLGACAAEVRSSRRWSSQMPFMLEILPGNNAPRITCTYQTRLFRKDSADALLRHYRTLLAHAIADPDEQLGALRLMDEEERRLVTSEWPRNTQAYPRDASVPALFRQVARERPDATALVLGDRQMNYAELDRLSSRVAAGLRRRGAGRGTRIGLCLDRSFEAIVGMLGILKAGAAYVPLDPEYPPARLKMMIGDAQVLATLTDAGSLGRVRSLGAEPLLIEALFESGADASFTPVRVEPTEPAYLMYTSGSTGTPKGVLIPHRGIVRLVRGADYADVSKDETVLHASSPSFDVATFEIFAPLLNGGCLVLMPPAPPSVSDLQRAIEKHGVTTLWLTAGLFHLVADTAPEAFRPLRQLLAGGDVLSPAHVQKVLDACPDLRFINGYGPTENTTFSLCYTVPRDHHFASSIPIGYPIANSEAYVLDDHLRPQPVGMPGELFVGGDGLALSYWNRPELTAERFVKHPFVQDPDARLYRTGDMARLLPSGIVEFLGRRDSQLKIRGFRVELGEIEATLSKAPHVHQCIVVARKDGTGDARLIAYVRGETGRDAVGDAQSHARSLLPLYMIPAQWVPVDSFPLTPNGKVDRARLPDPPRAEHDASPGSAPSGRLEEQFLEIWRRLFHTEDVGCEDSFFDLGGNSLLAIRFVAEAERATGKPLPLNQLFLHPTIRELAAALQQVEVPGEKKALVPLAGGGDRPPLYIVHGWGGDVFGFRELARGIGADQPVFGIQAVEHRGFAARHSSIEAMARQYAQEIRAHQPEGPYYLLGFSVGGMIAYETACVLHRSGAEVGMVFVLDTHPSNLPMSVRLSASAGYLARRAGYHAKTILSASPQRALSSLRLRGKALAVHVRPRGLRQNGHSAEPIAVPIGSDYYQVLGARYVPQPCALPVTVLQASDSHFNQRVAWQHLQPSSLEVVPLSGKHLELLSGPAFREIVRVLRERLEALQARVPA